MQFLTQAADDDGTGGECSDDAHPTLGSTFGLLALPGAGGPFSLNSTCPKVHMFYVPCSLPL